MKNEVIDLRGTRCPLTLLKIKQYLYQGHHLDTYTFLFDDAGAATDLPLFLSRDQRWALSIEKKSIEEQGQEEQGIEYMAICSCSGRDRNSNNRNSNKGESL